MLTGISCAPCGPARRLIQAATSVSMSSLEVEIKARRDEIGDLAEADPVVVQQCLHAGIADYLLYPSELQALLVRVKRAAGRPQPLGERLALVATPYLGPAARVFLQQQVRAHLPGGALDTLKPEHLPVLFNGVRAAGIIVLGKRVEELVRQLEAAFRTTGSPAPTG